MEPRVLKHELRGDGEAVVLVPGGLTGWLSWIPHAERLAARFRTVRVQPIHNELGSAGRPGDPAYTTDTERESLRMTLDELGIDTAHFAGWSGGGRALLEFALTHPQRVISLTLVEPAAYWVLEQLGEPDPGVEAVGSLVGRRGGRDVSEDDLAEFLEIAGFVESKEQAPSHPNWERWLPHRMSLSWQDQLETSGRTVEELAQIRCPVLLFKGTVTSPWLKRVVDVLGERVPGARVVELPGDHACHIQSIDRFLEAFEEHVGRG